MFTFQNLYLQHQMGQSIQDLWKTVFKNLWKTAFNRLSIPFPFKFFKGCLPQILLSPLLNTLSQMK